MRCSVCTVSALRRLLGGVQVRPTRSRTAVRPCLAISTRAFSTLAGKVDCIAWCPGAGDLGQLSAQKRPGLGILFSEPSDVANRWPPVVITTTCWHLRACESGSTEFRKLNMPSSSTDHHEIAPHHAASKSSADATPSVSVRRFLVACQPVLDVIPRRTRRREQCGTTGTTLWGAAPQVPRCPAVAPRHKRMMPTLVSRQIQP